MRLGSADFCVEVTSQDRPPVDWLVEFFTPWLTPVDRAPVRQLRLSIDARRHRSVTRSALPASAGPATIPCFVFDTRVVSHPVVSDGDGRQWIRDDELEVLYGPTLDRRDMLILAPRDGTEARVALMRVVREWWTFGLRSGGAALLHAAAVMHAGRGVALAGPKRAGKTTTLLHLLRASQAKLVSNDRLAVQTTSDGRWKASGIPTVVALRGGTIDLLSDMAAPLRASTAVFDRTDAEDRSWHAGPPATSDRGDIDLSPRQFCRIIERPAAASMPLDAILLPIVDGSTSGLEVDRLSAREALPLLLDSRLAANLERASAEAMIPTEVASTDPARDLHGADAMAPLELLAGSVPCIRTRLGIGAFADPGTAAGLWERLF